MIIADFKLKFYVAFFNLYTFTQIVYKIIDPKKATKEMLSLFLFNYPPLSSFSVSPSKHRYDQPRC